MLKSNKENLKSSILHTQQPKPYSYPEELLEYSTRFVYSVKACLFSWTIKENKLPNQTTFPNSFCFQADFLTECPMSFALLLSVLCEMAVVVVGTMKAKGGA